MFFGSDYGSERTCCLNGIDPQAYLRQFVVYDVIDRNMYLELLVVGFYRVFCSIS